MRVYPSIYQSNRSNDPSSDVIQTTEIQPDDLKRVLEIEADQFHALDPSAGIVA